MPDNDTKIKNTIRQWIAACNAGDAEAFQNTLTSNFVWMPPDAPKLVR
jgi:ketosteroid isomerase-like protein